MNHNNNNNKEKNRSRRRVSRASTAPAVFAPRWLSLSHGCCVSFWCRCSSMRPQWGWWPERVPHGRTSCWITTCDAGRTASTLQVKNSPRLLWHIVHVTELPRPSFVFASSRRSLLHCPHKRGITVFILDSTFLCRALLFLPRVSRQTVSESGLMPFCWPAATCPCPC